MLDHISLRVQDYDRALAFYRSALASIGYEVVMEFPEVSVAGLGEKGKPDLWITKTDKPTNPIHIAFTSDRSCVDAFHAAALAAGGSDNGPAGPRPEYHPGYYGAFVLDPEGNNIEVVCHQPPGAIKTAGSPATSPRRKKRTAKPTSARRSPARRAAKRVAKPSKPPRGRTKSRGPRK